MDLNIHTTINRITLKIMLSSIPHQKFCFYHLPTRGRAGIKLEDTWYVSNISIIFYCSMLYYILFWTLLGFIIHFYIIFGTNQLTGGPTQNCCFLPILGFRRKGISNRVQTEWNLRQRDFLEEYHPGDLELMSEDPRGGHEIGEAPPYWARPLSRGPLEHLPTDFFRLYKPTYPKTIEYQDKMGVPLPQASVATKNLSGVHSGTLPVG